MKSLYLQSLKDALKTHNKESALEIHAYTCMDNHFHNLMNYLKESSKLSSFLRQAHALFGSRYNRIHKRSGKVAEGRPKTSLIENTDHQMRVHFYIEANPLRAGKCTEKQLRAYKYSSYRFYAYGIEDEFTDILTIPDWYIALGSTPQERQAKYRNLFQEYLKDTNFTNFFAPFIGSPIWVLKTQQTVIEQVKEAALISSA
ncbi:MAG: transposase [Bdellovibrionales bacterium]